MAVILINGPCLFVQIFFNRRFHIKFEENALVFQRRCHSKVWTDDDGQQVMTIAHLEPSAQVS